MVTGYRPLVFTKEISEGLRSLCSHGGEDLKAILEELGSEREQGHLLNT